MSERIVMRVGEALVAGGPPGTAAEPEIVIGELDGPVGQAFAQLIGDQVKGHSRVLAIMNTDIIVKPATHNKPDIDWLLKNQAQIVLKYYQMGLDGKI